jgi:DNA (cytosine-5)-methyltransferase 1
MTDAVLSVADIYCGAGGLSAGFEKARMVLSDNQIARCEIVYGLDRDCNAVKTFNEYHAKVNGRQDVAECKSVTEVTGEGILTYAKTKTIDILIGGPNCQGVSAAGLRNPDDKRNEMFRRYVELVKELKPQWFVMENVPGLTHSNNRNLLRAVMEELSSLPGYTVAADVLLAADYEAPQFRYRVFFVGNRIGAPIRFPPPKIASTKDYHTVRHAIWDLRDETLGDSGKIKNHIALEIKEDNVRRIQSIEPGEDWRDMPVHLLPERFFATRASDQKGTYGRLEWDWPAYTITSSVSNVTAGPFTHPEKNRPLTVREAARLQSFDDEHVIEGPIDSQYRQVGNAVPPLLAKAVAEAIMKCHFQPEIAQTWGHEGRITLDLLLAVENGEANFPVLTPRFPGPTPKWERRQTVDANADSVKIKHKQKSAVRFKWSKPRPENPFPKDMETLKALAAQPGNYRAAKRAKVILAYFEGVTKDVILKQSNVSVASAKKWISGFLNNGLEGWRAYHTSVADVLVDNPELAARVKTATLQVRTASSEIRLAQNGNKRLHMNDYLLGLQKQFGQDSVRELISQTERRLGRRIGTVYVGDLLAIADVVLNADAMKQTIPTTNKTTSS